MKNFISAKLAGSILLVAFGLLAIFAYLLLNTLGNLASGISFESLVAAPATIILALCALRLATEE